MKIPSKQYFTIGHEKRK